MTLKDPNLYPFLFYLPAKKEDCELLDIPPREREEWHVKIAKFDYRIYKSGWMSDEKLGKLCLVPDVDLTQERHIFYSETEALAFIANWWKQQYISN